MSQYAVLRSGRLLILIWRQLDGMIERHGAAREFAVLTIIAVSLPPPSTPERRIMSEALAVRHCMRVTLVRGQPDDWIEDPGALAEALAEQRGRRRAVVG